MSNYCWLYNIRLKNRNDDLKQYNLTEDDVKKLRTSDFIFEFVDKEEKDKCIELKKFIEKYNGKGWIHAIKPNGDAFIGFIIDMGHYKDVPVRMEVPRIYYRDKYLEKESYRALLLIVKSKMVEIETGEPIERVFLANIPTQFRTQMMPHVADLDLLTDGK